MNTIESPKSEPAKIKPNDENYEKNEEMKKNKKLTKCKTCNQYIARTAKRCPSCGAKNKKPLLKRWWFWILAVLVFLIIAIPKSAPSSSKALTMGLDEYKELCKLIPYKELARTPDEYKNVDIKSGGTILQIMNSGSTQILRIEANGDMNDIFAVAYKPKEGSEKLLEDDIVNFYGSFVGLEKYKTIFGKEISVPAVNAAYVLKATSDSMLSDKPSKGFLIGETAEYDGKLLTITKVQTSKGSGYTKPDKGKIFYIVSVIIENKGSENFSYNPNDFKMLNDNGQIDDYSWSAPDGIEQIGAGELAPQGKIEGKIVFQEPINSKKLTLQYYGSMFDNQSTFKIIIK